MTNPQGLAAGIDGCRSGWLCLTADAALRVRPRLLRRLEDLDGPDPAPDVALIDIPLGLVRAGQRGCDRAARSALGRPRAASVFAAPVRAVTQARDYDQARSLGRAADGLAPSLQTWNILPKIKEADAFLLARPAWRGRLREAHPELCFAAMNGMRPMAASKKTAGGRAEREALVRSFFGQALEEARAALSGGQGRAAFAQDDLLDAFACLWSALRALKGEAVSLPLAPEHDEHGIRMEIVY